MAPVSSNGALKWPQVLSSVLHLLVSTLMAIGWHAFQQQSEQLLDLSKAMTAVAIEQARLSAVLDERMKVIDRNTHRLDELEKQAAADSKP